MELTWYSLQSYFRYDEEEIRGLAALSLMFAFILSFDQWGVEEFSLLLGLKNFVIALVITTASLLIHDTAHRIVAIKMGYTVKLRIWWYGVVTCLVLAFMSNGWLKLFVGCSIGFTHLAQRRLGRMEYKYAPKHLGLISLVGPVASMIFAGLIRAIAQYAPLNPSAVNELVYFNVVFGVLSFLPIPPLDGSKFFFYGRLPYLFAGSVILSYGLLHVVGFPSIILSLLVGIAAGAYFLHKEGDIVKR